MIFHFSASKKAVSESEQTDKESSITGRFRESTHVKFADIKVKKS